MSNWLKGILAISLACTLPACGGSTSKRRVVKEAPKLPPVAPEALRQFDRGLRALKLKGPRANSKAAKRFRAAVEIDEKLWEAWHNLGVIALEEGETEEAIESFSKALNVNPVHEAAISGRAEAYRQIGENKKAAKDYRQLVDLQSNSASVYARLASLLRLNKDYDEGLDLLREGLRLVGATSEIYAELGLIYMAQGRDELAKLVLSRALEMDTKGPAIYNALALIAMEEGKDQQAFALFDKAAELDPKYVDARYNKAGILIDVGDYNAAAAELQSLVDIAPEDIAAKVALGAALRGAGKHEDAKAIWEEVADSTPTRSHLRSDALFNLAILEADFVMDDAKAIAALDRYLQDAKSSHSKHQEAVELRKDLGQ